jgi:hypothetical protein
MRDDLGKIKRLDSENRRVRLERDYRAVKFTRADFFDRGFSFALRIFLNVFAAVFVDLNLTINRESAPTP